LRMMFAGLDEIRGRAERVASNLEEMHSSVRPDESVAGGGSLPDQTVPTWVIELDVPSAIEFEKRLRAGVCPVISRIENGKVVLDMRTVDDREVDALVTAVKAATQPLPQQHSQPAHP